MAKKKQVWNNPWNNSWWGKTTAGDLQQEMTGTTSVFGRDKSLKVQFKGTEVVTEFGMVTFPAIDPSVSFDYDSVKLFRGWVDSEAALARFSSQTFMDSKKELIRTNRQLYDVFKAIECSRVEAKYTDFYPGAGKHLAQVSNEMFLKASEVFTEEAHFYPTAIGMLARARMEGVFNHHFCTLLEKHIDRKKVEGWVDEIQRLKTPAESFALAERIVEQNPQKNPPPQGKGDGNSDGNNDGTQSQGESNPDSGDNPKKDMSHSSHNSVSIEAIIGEHIQNAVKLRRDVYGKDVRPYMVFTTEYDRFYHWRDDGWTEDIRAYLNAKEEMGAQLATAKRKLELMIQSTQKISWDPLKERGRFDSKRLVSAYQGEQNVFKVKCDDSDLDTAISVCIDLSGSMRGRKSCYAFKSTIILSELLSKIGVPFEVIGFDASIEPYPNSFKYEAQGLAYTGDYGRVAAIRMQEFKRFADRFFDARKYMHRISTLIGAGGGNVDGESVAKAAKRLMARPEKRRILIVLSDGLPSESANDNILFRHTQETIKDLESRVEMVGIGICSDSVSHFYNDHIVINNAENLPVTLLDLLGKKLLPHEKKKPIAA